MPRVRLFILYLDTEEDTSKGRVLVLTEKKNLSHLFFFLKCVDMSSDSIETLGSASFFFKMTSQVFFSSSCFGEKHVRDFADKREEKEGNLS